jgi:hypothetical protein
MDAVKGFARNFGMGLVYAVGIFGVAVVVGAGCNIGNKFGDRITDIGDNDVVVEDVVVVD